MDDRQAILSFVQLPTEAFDEAWWRYKLLLQQHPLHGFGPECQLLNFLDGLTRECRQWVEGDDGTLSIYDLHADDAILYVEEKVRYEQWKPKPALPMEGKAKMGPSASDGNGELVDDENPVDEDECVVEEETTSVTSSAYDITIIGPPQFIEASTYVDPIWPDSPTPSFAPYFSATKSFEPEHGLSAQVSRQRDYLAKLEDVQNQDPWCVFYDAYHGHKPLFEDKWQRRIRRQICKLGEDAIVILFYSFILFFCFALVLCILMLCIVCFEVFSQDETRKLYARDEAATTPPPPFKSVQ